MTKWADKLLENGLALAIAMGLVYAVSYFYLAGWLDAYLLPDEFMEIGLQEMISVVYTIIYSAWPVLILPWLVTLFSGKVHDPQLTYLIKLTTCLLALVLFSVSILHRFININWILLGIIIFEWTESVMKPLIHCRTVKGFTAKWQAFYKKEEQEEQLFESLEKSSDKDKETPELQEQQQTLSGKIMGQRLGSLVAWIALVVAVLFVLVQTMDSKGREDALNREDFFIAKEYNDMAVVFQTDARFILMERDGSQLSSNYIVVENNGGVDSCGELRYEHTGKLLPPNAAKTAQD